MLPEFDQDDTSQSNYPIAEDSSFTADEISAIQKYKESLQIRLNKNQSILKGLEVGFWGLTSYSIARYIVLSVGLRGVGLAIATTFLINNITNRDCLDSVHVDRKEGEWHVNGIGKLIKFVFSTLLASFIIWSAVGDLLKLADNSSQTYNALQNKVEQFNRLPSGQQNTILVVGGIIGLAGIFTIVDHLKKR